MKDTTSRDSRAGRVKHGPTPTRAQARARRKNPPARRGVMVNPFSATFERMGDMLKKRSKDATRKRKEQRYKPPPPKPQRYARWKAGIEGRTRG